MRSKLFGMLVLISVSIAPVSAQAEHESLPMWPPTIGVKSPIGIATGGSMCHLQSVQLIIDETTVNYTAYAMSGKAMVEGRSTCSTVESGVESSIGVSLYQQEAPHGRLTFDTVGVTHAPMTLLGTFRCERLDPTTDHNVCRTPAISFRAGPGARIVATNGTTYRLYDPRGAAWFAHHPDCRLSQSSRAVLYCLTAAEIRA